MKRTTLHEREGLPAREDRFLHALIYYYWLADAKCSIERQSRGREHSPAHTAHPLLPLKETTPEVSL